MEPSDRELPSSSGQVTDEESHERLGALQGAADEIIELGVCWRCEKDYETRLHQCPFCHARNRAAAAGQQPAGSGPADSFRKGSPGIVKTVWAFAALALTSIVSAIAAALGGDNIAIGTLEWAKETLTMISLVEIIDCGLVFLALWLISCRPKWPEVKSLSLAWILAIPLFAAAIAINLGFHFLLRDFFQLPEIEAAVTDFPQLLPWCVIVLCVQPAIIEELFFRHLALGTALEVVPPVSAVLISSLLFAMAHLGMPFSMPYLALLGIILGYLRLKSGTLWLPIAFHFFHNLVVLLIP